jgi:hypothetical protein
MVRMYSSSREEAYKPARKELTTFAVLTIISILLTITNACMCAHNYNKGLKPYVNQRTGPIDDDEKPIPMGSSAYASYAPDMEQGPGGRMPAARPSQNRMEID